MTTLSVPQVVVDALMSGLLTIDEDRHFSERPHLIPVSVPPVCDTCKGSKRYPAEFAPFYDTCPTCNGFGLPSVLTLTVECEQCHGAGASWFADCPCSWCKGSGQRPVCRVTIEKAVPIVVVGTDDYLNLKEQAYVARTTLTADAMFYTTADLMSSATTDVSHLLLPGLVWDGYALIVTNVEAT